MSFKVGDQVVCIYARYPLKNGCRYLVVGCEGNDLVRVDLGAGESDSFFESRFELVEAPPADVGLKFDDGKPRMDLLPMDALEAVAMVLRYGATEKVRPDGQRGYGDRNWEKGLAWGRLAGAALRHLGAWMRGVELDAESGLPHLHHFGCCALMLIALVLRKKGEDTRGVTP
jgi:hypothetical protein